MDFTNAEVGPRLFDTITSGLYDRNLNCIREYVQNAVDEKAKNIDIRLEGLNLIIRDDGPGMDKEELKYALQVGQSKKTDPKVGWRGIGIWSGVSASEKLVIITKKEKNQN